MREPPRTSFKDETTQNKLLDCSPWFDCDDFHNMENIKQMREQQNVSLGCVLLRWGAMRVSVRLAFPDILRLPFALMLVLLVFICGCWGSGKCVCVDSTSPWTIAFV